MMRPTRGCRALVLACTLAVLAAAAHGRALADGAAPEVHGLAPLPGGVAVPLADRPPGASADETGPSPVIFPPQRPGIRFSHAQHAGKLGLACRDCHRRAGTSRRSSDRLLPEGRRCDRCHGTDHRDLTAVRRDPDRDSGRCDTCHLGYHAADGNRATRLVLPRPALTFSHAAHAVRNIGCTQCHGWVTHLELAARDQLPRMRGCLRCHDLPQPAGGDASGECATCHLTERNGRLLTRLASGALRPPTWLRGSAHDADWIERHRTVAGNDSRLCTECHSESSCTDCHDGRVRPRKIHSNDWLSLHAVAGRQDDPRCTSCHQTQSFCVPCHQRTGVAQSGPYDNFAGRGRLHPPKAVWSDGPRTARHHAIEAQRNLASCVSCHVERDCTVCHATAARGGPGTGFGGVGPGTNPHPAGFGQRCRIALEKNPRPCLVCHASSDPNLSACQ
jgi:hypothetical protein